MKHKSLLMVIILSIHSCTVIPGIISGLFEDYIKLFLLSSMALICPATPVLVSFLLSYVFFFFSFRPEIQMVKMAIPSLEKIVSNALGIHICCWLECKWVHFGDTAIDYMLVSPQSHMLKPNLSYDGVLRWGYWEVIRSWAWGPHEWD